MCKSLWEPTLGILGLKQKMQGTRALDGSVTCLFFIMLSSLTKVRSLVEKLTRPKLQAIFSKYQASAGFSINGMLFVCESRWGSVYKIHKRDLQQKQAIKLAEANPDLGVVAEPKVTADITRYFPLIHDLFCKNKYNYCPFTTS